MTQWLPQAGTPINHVKFGTDLTTVCTDQTVDLALMIALTQSEVNLVN